MRSQFDKTKGAYVCALYKYLGLIWWMIEDWILKSHIDGRAGGRTRRVSED